MNTDLEAAVERLALHLTRRLGIGFAHARTLALMAFSAAPRRA